MAFECSAKEFIKLYRKFINWEWYTDVNTKTLFIHCLLRANWKDGEWHGIPYKAGEFITSLQSLSKETGLTMRQARTSLSHLESTGELTSTLTNRATGKKLSRCRIITVNNWDSYQGATSKATSKATSSASGKRQASDKQRVRQTTTVEEDKKLRSKEVKRNIKEKAATLPPEEVAAAEEDDEDVMDFAAMTDEEFEKYLEATHGAV